MRCLHQLVRVSAATERMQVLVLAPAKVVRYPRVTVESDSSGRVRVAHVVQIPELLGQRGLHAEVGVGAVHTRLCKAGEATRFFPTCCASCPEPAVKNTSAQLHPSLWSTSCLRATAAPTQSSHLEANVLRHVIQDQRTAIRQIECNGLRRCNRNAGTLVSGGRTTTSSGHTAACDVHRPRDSPRCIASVLAM